jgi:APA family basic amino acid/polyamine antiporter
MGLDKSISLPQAIVYGVGVIVGAGIYTLIGITAGIAGPLLWAAFIVAGLIAALTAISYSKLTFLFPKEAAETVYVLEATKNKPLAFFIGILSFVTGLFSAATVSWGFSVYFKVFFPFNPIIVAITLLIILTIINLIGIRQSIALNNVMTFLTLIGLLLIVIYGAPHIGSVNLLEGIDGTNLLQNSFSLIPIIFSAAALIFFAFIGFEGIAKVSEEMKNGKRDAPKAIMYSLIITTIIYVAVSIVAVSVIAPSELASAANPNIPLTQGPLAIVADKAIFQGFGIWLSIFALCATASTILVLLNVSSRILYGMSSEGLLPSFFKKVSPKTKTPHNAIFFVLVLAILTVFVGNLELLGYLTTVGVFLLFFAVNGSLLVIDYKKEKKINILALLGTAFCLFMFLTQYWKPIDLFGFNIPLVILATLIFCLAFPIYYLYDMHRKKKK